MNKSNTITQKIAALAFCMFAAHTAAAQNTCTITGVFKRDSLRFTQKKVEKIYLSTTDEFDRFVEVDSAVVKDGKFVLTHHLKTDQPLMMYFLTGFDNGNIPLWVEPGNIEVAVRDAAFPGGAHVRGTYTNDLYVTYKRITDRCVDLQRDSIKAISEQMGKDYMNTPEAITRLNRIGAAALLDCNADRVNFLLEHHDSPLAPLMFQRELAYNFGANDAEKLLKSIAPSLHKHPYYRNFYNYIKAQNLKEGGELPDIKLTLDNGEVKYLSDYRGKYVLLDFWASWCGPCIKELPILKQLFADMKDKSDRFALISVSLDNKEPAWRNALKTHDMLQPGWIHASDLLGWGSPAVKLLGVEAIPHMILLDPEGRAISFKLRGEELARKVKEVVK
ncbi:MAG: TlpA disulfide reductase family protein [Prevotellaceae bacterium]|nr:TlpA disulfide reductase family protein [Prevotellaceae bacterium]MDY3365505.1 TlpA disulfide reductase family protein [Prevotella sp.]